MPTTYRYMSLATPTTPAIIADHVAPSAGAVSISVPPPTFIDVTLATPTSEDKEDLDEYMASIGYSFMEENPPALQDGDTLVWENGTWTCAHMASQTEKSLGEESTTRSEFGRKVRNVFTSDSATAKHVVMYDATLEVTSGNAWFEVQLVLDDDQNTPLASLKQKPGGSDRQIKFSGHIEPTVYGEGAHTIDIEYKRAGGSGSVKIKDAKVTIWRVF
jgi:hypothetical protein